MSRRRAVLGLVLAGGLTACAGLVGSHVPELQTVTVAPNTAPCLSDARQACLLVKTPFYATCWHLLDAPGYERDIAGFVYEPGFQYQLQVRSEVTLGAPAFKRRLTWLETQAKLPDSSVAVPCGAGSQKEERA